MGTSEASQNTKKRTRSRDEKIPATIAERPSNAAQKPRAWVFTSCQEATSTSTVSSEATGKKSTLIPSTPR